MDDGNAIGNLSKEICQDYDPYTNISQCGIIQAQMNTIKSMMPNLSFKNKDKHPVKSVDLSEGYILLQPCESITHAISTQEAEAILELWCKEQWPNRDGWSNHKTIICWAQLHLPNGQKVHSVWGEGQLHHKPKQTMIVRVHTPS